MSDAEGYPKAGSWLYSEVVDQDTLLLEHLIFNIICEFI